MNLYNLFETPKRTPAPGTTGVMDNQTQTSLSPIGSGTSEWESKKKPVTMMGVGNNGVVAEARDVQLDELSNRILGNYKKAAGADARAADRAGDFKRGDKRFKGIVQATKKELANDVKQHKTVDEGQLEVNTPNPVVVVQDLKGNILDKINLSVAAQKYKLGDVQNIKNQLAHQNYTTIGNYVIVSPMSGQPQDATTQTQPQAQPQGVAEAHNAAAKEIHGNLFHDSIPPGAEKHHVSAVLKAHGLKDTDAKDVIDRVRKMGYTGSRLGKPETDEGRMVKGPGGVPLDRQGRPVVAKVKAPEPLRMRKWLVIHDGSHGEGGKDIIEAPNAETAWELANEYDLYIIDIKPYRGPAGPTLVDEGSLEEDRGMKQYWAFKREWRAKHGANAKVPAYDSKEYNAYCWRQGDKQQGVAEGMKADELSRYCEELVAEKGWDRAYKHAQFMAQGATDPAWGSVLKYLQAMKQGISESLGRAAPKMPKPRDPGHAVLAAKRSSGAGGQHTNKKRQAILQPKHQKPLTRDMDLGEDISRRGFLRGAGAVAAGAAMSGMAHAAEKTDPNKLIARVSFEGDTKEFDLTGKFKGDAKSQLSQASDWLTEFLEAREIDFSNFELRYQGTVLKTKNSTANMGMLNRESIEESIERRLMQMRHAGYDIT